MQKDKPINEDFSVVPGTALFGIQFAEGQVLFDFWPDDLSKTVGRMAVLPWKTCYEDQGIPDSISCGKIVSARDGMVEIQHHGGTSQVRVEHAFLVPNPGHQGTTHLVRRTLDGVVRHEDSK